MPFVDGEATSQLQFVLKGAGTEYMTSVATSTLSFAVSANLLKVARIRRAKPTSPTRIRVDFTAHVDNNTALTNVDNWRLYTFNVYEFQAPTILGVEVPSGAGSNTKYVILVVSEMHQGAAYVLTANSLELSYGPNLIIDGDMELPDESEWLNLGAPAYVNKGAGYGSNVMFIGTTADNDGIQPANSGEMAKHRLYAVSGTFRTGDGVLPKLTDTNGQVFFSPDLALASTAQPPYIGLTNSKVFVSPDADGTIQFRTLTGNGEVSFDDLALQTVFGTGDSSAILITAGGVPVAKDPMPFLGLGAAPFIKVVLATSETYVTVFFSEQIAKDEDVLFVDKTSFQFSNGLTVQSIEEIGDDYIKLRTSTQTAGALYTLTIDGFSLYTSIVDLAGNKLSLPAVASMLGFMPGSPIETVQQLRMYMFLIEGIRQEDQSNGAKFVERLFDGPQQVWEGTTQQILAIPQIWDLSKVPDSILPFVKDIVGWTRKLDGITDRLTADALRRLISVSITFWKQRGNDDVIEDILRMINGTRCRVLDWFWYRWILEETALGEDHDGIDPWLLSSPGEGPDPQTYAVRIVDNGELDYDLIRAVLKLTRPTGERVDVSYVNFSDTFPVDLDKSQWTDVSGTSAVMSRRLSMSDDGIDEDTEVNVEGAVDWTNLTATFRIKGTGVFFMDVYRLPGGLDTYRLEVNIADNQAELCSYAGGVKTSLDVYSFGPPNGPPDGETLVNNVFYTFRIVVTPQIPDSPVSDIKVYWEANLITHITDQGYASGTLAVGHYAGGTVTVSEVEMFFNPMLTDFIDINS